MKKSYTKEELKTKAEELRKATEGFLEKGTMASAAVAAGHEAIKLFIESLEDK